MNIQILGPDSRGMCYFYVSELPDVLVIANDCVKRTLDEKDEDYHVILYCIRHNENYHVPKYFRTTEPGFLYREILPNWGWVGRGNYHEELRIMQPSGYRCWYKSGPLFEIQKNLIMLMEIYKNNTTSNSK